MEPRTITLSVPLIASIIAGHLLMTLLDNQLAVASNIILLSFIIITQFLLEPKKASEVSTGLKMETQTFTWRITNFDMIRHSDDLIEAQEFSFKAGETIDLETEWRVYLRIGNKTGGEGNDNENWVGIYVKCTKRPVDVNQVIALCEISILSENNQHVQKFGMLKPKEGKNYAQLDWGFRKFIRKDSEDYIWTDGSLVVGIKFHLYAPTPPPAMITAVHGTVASVQEQFQPVFIKKLQSDLEGLLNGSSQTSDVKVKIVSKDKKEFEVNGGVLSVRSSVFGKMLEVDMKEANTGVISIDDLSSKTVTVLLQFIYTGKLHEDWSSPDVIVPLVYAAAKYQLLDLQEFLDSVLGKVCSNKTAGLLLNLADKLGMKKATQEILERINTDFSSDDDMMVLFCSSSEFDFH